MVPLKILKSCGNSSNFVERKNLPTVVEDFDLSFSVLILNIVNCFPYCPILFWVNNPNDWVSIEAIQIVSKIINPKKSNPTIAKDKSNMRFVVNFKGGILWVLREYQLQCSCREHRKSLQLQHQ